MRLPLPICVETADLGKGQGFGIGHGLSMARQAGCLQCWISSVLQGHRAIAAAGRGF